MFSVYFTMLYCTALYCTILYRIKLDYTIRCYTVLPHMEKQATYDTRLYYKKTHYNVRLFKILGFTLLCLALSQYQRAYKSIYPVLYYTVLYFTLLCYTILIMLDCTVLLILYYATAR